jgi:hypothetical protein
MIWLRRGIPFEVVPERRNVVFQCTTSQIQPSDAAIGIEDVLNVPRDILWGAEDK